MNKRDKILCLRGQSTIATSTYETTRSKTCNACHGIAYIHVKGPMAAMRFIHVRIVGPTFSILRLSMVFFSF
jgi:hypothetical protein